jgi:hypothetical protein
MILDNNFFDFHLSNLKKEGYSRLGKVFNSSDIESLNRIFEETNNDNNHWCKISKNQNNLLLKYNEINTNSKIFQILNKSELFNINKYYPDYYNEKLKFFGIFLADTIGTSAKRGELPFIPHIDKHHRIKIIIYLTDVSKNSGPLEIWPKSQNLIADKRLSHRISNKNMSLFENVMEIKDKPIKLDGASGECILFDTNVFHQAGSGQENLKRRVIRIDFINQTEFDHEIDTSIIGKIKTYRYLKKHKYPSFKPLFKV